METPNPERGEVWQVDWTPGRGSEQTGRRPAVIVQTDPANHNPRYPNNIVVAVSTKGREVPSHVRVEPSKTNGLSATSFVKCEQLLTTSKERLHKRLGRLSRDEMREVDKALRLVLAL